MVDVFTLEFLLGSTYPSCFLTFYELKSNISWSSGLLCFSLGVAYALTSSKFSIKSTMDPLTVGEESSKAPSGLDFWSGSFI
jgi:hypothetical protein